MVYGPVGGRDGVHGAVAGAGADGEDRGSSVAVEGGGLLWAVGPGTWSLEQLS